MSEDKIESPKPGGAASAAKSERSTGTLVLGIILPALLAGGASFGGVRLAGAMHAPALGPTSHTEAVKPPGPTVALEPFIAAVRDQEQRPHAMKVVIAVELETGAKEDEFKAFVPRIRDATLAYLRERSYEEVADNTQVDLIRRELLTRMRAVGAKSASQILITDFVVQ